MTTQTITTSCEGERKAHCLFVRTSTSDTIFRDYTKRYQSNAPTSGYTPPEARARYSIRHLPPFFLVFLGWDCSDLRISRTNWKKQSSLLYFFFALVSKKAQPQVRASACPSSNLTCRSSLRSHLFPTSTLHRRFKSARNQWSGKHTLPKATT